jgi:hypothetical protein
LLSRSDISHLHAYGDFTTTIEGLQNVGLCSAFRAPYILNFVDVNIIVLDLSITPVPHPQGKILKAMIF